MSHGFDEIIDIIKLICVRIKKIYHTNENWETCKDDIYIKYLSFLKKMENKYSDLDTHSVKENVYKEALILEDADFVNIIESKENVLHGT